MELKIIVLKIIKENNPIGIHKFDRLYYSKASYKDNWVPIVDELRKDELLEKEGFKLTQKGLAYLNNHSD